MYTTIGERLSYCRNLLALSRTEFVEQIKNISIASLNRWELDYVKIPNKQLENIVLFLNSRGIFVSSEWILNGTGESPINDNLKNLNSLNFDEITHLTLMSLKNNINGLDFFTISNNFFDPILHHGDYVAGVFSDELKMLTNQVCFVMQGSGITVGVFDYHTKTLTNWFQKTMQLNSDYKVAKILWSAKRF